MMVSLFKPPACAEKLQMMRWRSTGLAKAAMSSVVT